MCRLVYQHSAEVIFHHGVTGNIGDGSEDRKKGDEHYRNRVDRLCHLIFFTSDPSSSKVVSCFESEG